MKRSFLNLLIAYLLIISCERNNLVIDPDYPTTFYPRAEAEISEMKSSLSNEYPYLHSTLNNFGFFSSPEYIEVNDPPPISLILTEAESVSLAKQFISKHTNETGVDNLNDLSISDVYSLSGGTHWIVRTSTQKVDTVEVIYTSIIFGFKNGEIVNCSGNWFPNIYIPHNFNVNENQAKNSIIGETVTHHDIFGNEWYLTIKKDDLEKSITVLKIVPNTLANKIELRVAWMIYVPTVEYIIYIDVMTGKILKKDPTIIV